MVTLETFSSIFPDKQQELVNSINDTLLEEGITRPTKNHLFHSLVKISRSSRELCRIMTNSFITERESPDKISLLKDKIGFARKDLSLLIKLTIKNFPLSTNNIELFCEWAGAFFVEVEEASLESSLRPPNVVLDEKSIVNLTNIFLPNDIMLVLSFGPKFCFPPVSNLINTAHFLTHALISISGFFPVETHLEIYKQISIEMNIDRRRNTIYRDIWLDFLHFRINKFSLKLEDILITRSDKGKHTVILYKQDYIDKLNQLILETNDYEKIDSIDLSRLESINNEFIDLLAQHGFFKILNPKDPSGHGNEYKQYCTTPARMYGLVKIHKPGYPLRTITSACSAVGFSLAKIFTHVLSDVFCEDGFHIKNSKELKEALNGCEIREEETMVSFDVVQMFTNILIDHMLSIIKTREQIIFHKYNIPFPLFSNIFKFILRDCAIFKWQNIWYKQIESLAMGSPLSPILAKILMTNVMEFTIPRLPSPPKILALYVDDSFCILLRNNCNSTLDILNSYHPRIKFTMELEKDSKINFLDITIHRTDTGSVITNWYKKPFASSRLLNYYSHHETSCITQTAIAFVKMVLNLSHPSFFLSNKKIVEDVLRSNSFPETEIIGIIHNHYTFMTPMLSTQKYSGNYVPILYRSDLTKGLKRKLSPFLLNERLVGIPDRVDTNIYSPIKDKLELGDKTNIIIFLTCQCDKFMKMGYTGYRERASCCIDKLSVGVNTSKGKCCSVTHRFNKIKSIQCKSYTYAQTLHNMLTFNYKDKLIQTSVSPPIFRLNKHLVLAQIDDNNTINHI